MCRYAIYTVNCFFLGSIDISYQRSVYWSKYQMENIFTLPSTSSDFLFKFLPKPNLGSPDIWTTVQKCSNYDLHDDHHNMIAYKNK